MKRFTVCIGIAAAGLIVSGAPSSALEYSGKITNDIGRPAANARISLEKVSEPGKAVSVVTDTTGTFSFVVSEAAKPRQPIPFNLYGNYPNPFNPQTRISYSIDQSSEVAVTIYNVLGQLVRTLKEGQRAPGFYTVAWDGRNNGGAGCSAGVYLYRIAAGNRSISSKMLMVDSATGSWIKNSAVPLASYKGNEDTLYMVTVTHPDAETLVVGPITVSNSQGNVLTINRIMDKMQLISHNTYMRGSEWYHYTKPIHKVVITHDFMMDKYEVTAGLFSRVMNHALQRGVIMVDTLTVKNTIGKKQPLVRFDSPEQLTNICIEYKDGAIVPKKGKEKYPITNVSWYGAMFFCFERSLMEGFPQAIDLDTWTCDFKSAGYRLPTDAEWELAAAWTDRREYAFGPDPGEYRPMNTQLNADGFEDCLSPVGWFSPQGDSHDGLSDMSGNVYEWTTDWMEYYHESWADSTLVDPIGPLKSTELKTCRGGSAYGCFRAGRTGDKANVWPYYLTSEIGFRSIRVVKK